MNDELSSLRIRYSGEVIRGLGTLRRAYMLTLLQRLLVNVIICAVSIWLGVYFYAVLSAIVFLVFSKIDRNNYVDANNVLYSEFRDSYFLDDPIELNKRLNELVEYNA